MNRLFQRIFGEDWKQKAVWGVVLLGWNIRARVSRRFFYLKAMELVISSRCTLRCRYCANLMPCYKQPHDFETAQLLQDIEDLLQVVSRINVISVIGGEPLLHDGLAVILKRLVEEKRIREVLIVSNGTLLPSAELLPVLKHRKILLRVSNYYPHSKKLNELLDVCREEGVRCEVVSPVWHDPGFSSTPETDPGELQRRFQNCFAQCREFLDGEFHLCPPSANGVQVGLVPCDQSSCVDIRTDLRKSGADAVRKKMRALLNVSSIRACAYCRNNLDGKSHVVASGGNQIPPGWYLNPSSLKVEKITEES